MKDKSGNERGHCLQCDCEEYEPEKNSHKCDFCSHNPMQHMLITKMAEGEFQFM